jgi:hypothetical protein
MSKKPSREALQETFALLGMAVHMLHQIESNFAQATLLGVTNKQKRKYATINDLWNARDKMTFGQMVTHFKEDWILEPGFEELLDGFVAERNIVVHHLTALKAYGVERAKNRKKLNARIVAFIEQSFFIHKFFHGAYLASNEFASYAVKDVRGIDIPFTTPNEWLDDRDMFLSLVTYRHKPGNALED